MLYHYQRVAQILEVLKCFDEFPVIPLMQSYTRFIQYISYSYKTRAYLCGQPYTLCLAS